MYLPSCLNSSTSESGGSSVEGPCSPCIAPTSFSPGGASDDTVILPRTESLIWSIKSTSMATRISYSSFTVWCWSTTTAWKSGLLWNRHGFKGVRAKMLKTFSYRRKMIIQEDSVVQWFSGSDSVVAKTLKNFYRCTIESILSGCITAWYGSCSAADRKALQRVVKTAERIIGGHLPSVQGIYNSRCLRKARNIVKDHSHPGYGLFTLLPSGRRYRSIRARTTRLTNSFYPQAVRLLNQQHWTVAITLYFTPIQIHLLHIYINPHFLSYLI